MVDFDDMSYESLKKAIERKFKVEMPDEAGRFLTKEDLNRDGSSMLHLSKALISSIKDCGLNVEAWSVGIDIDEEEEIIILDLRTIDFEEKVDAFVRKLNELNEDN